jgi:hypothetical protein
MHLPFQESITNTNNYYTHHNTFNSSSAISKNRVMHLCVSPFLEIHTDRKANNVAEKFELTCFTRLDQILFWSGESAAGYILRKDQ